MRQALHIFKKDVRHLWIEIAVTLLVVAAFTFTGARRALWLTDPAVNRTMAWALLGVLLPLAWWTLIARLIHGEALPGDRQFWTTRPYAWKSLLGAKALFCAAFVNLPLLAAHAAILHAYGFHIGAVLPGLLWSQVLLTAGFVLPIAALSAVTTGFVQLLLTSLILFLAAVGWSIAAPVASLGVGWGALSALNWIESYYALVVVAIAATAILLWQYARRKTAASRSLAAIAVLLAAMGTMLIPWTTAFALQSRLSRQPIDQAAVCVGFDSAMKWAARALIESGGRVSVEIPLQIGGIPDGMILIPEGLTVTIEAPDGAVWRADQQPWTHVLSNGLVASTVDQRFYNQVKDQTVRFRGSLYLTLYGNRRITDIPLQDRPVVTPGMGLCSVSRGAGGQSYLLVCSSAFRWQPDLVSIRFVPLGERTPVEGMTYSPQQVISYSPFPAEFSIDPVSQYMTYSMFRGPLSVARVATVEPVAHIRRDFDFGGLRLSDFEVRTAVP